MKVVTMNELLADPLWCAQKDAERRAAVAKRKAAGVVSIRKDLPMSMMIRKADSLHAYDRILQAAAEIRKADATIDEAASVSKALEVEPQLYAQYRAERLAGVRPVQPVTKTSAPPTKGPALVKLEAAAQRLQTAESMTPAEAMAAVVERHPDLYAEYREERRQLLKKGGR